MIPGHHNKHLHFIHIYVTSSALTIKNQIVINIKKQPNASIIDLNCTPLIEPYLL